MSFKPDWDKTGSKITGNYYNRPYNGIIEKSRVMYGGDVEYTVRLLDHINMGTDTNPDYRSTILVMREKDNGKYQLID